jgi:beta-1,2-mannobiose phosphorylase / 1,2-beta-oligomannan phosphorylase
MTLRINYFIVQLKKRQSCRIFFFLIKPMPPVKRTLAAKKASTKKTTSPVVKKRVPVGKNSAAKKISRRGMSSALTAKVHPELLPEILRKHHGNPIIEPRPHVTWESKATFNPGAVEIDGSIHLLYRAIGDQDISVVGHAISSDGLTIDMRSDVPAYIPELIPHAKQRITESALPGNGTYTSGGGWWGGSEDPRATYIKEDKRIYMLYVAYDGWSPPRVALTSIGINDFLGRQWDNWSQAKVISMPPEELAKDKRFKDVVDKNACLLPEKINGKYVIFHRIFPDILVDFVDNLDFDNEYLKGEHKISPRPGYWDSRKVGAGAPPIKTKDGWLLIYQAVGDQDPGRYKIGAMLLDLNDPTKVLYRSNEPALVPQEWYENNGWKHGVVYPCGAVEKNGTLFVYYGGADSVVCVATAKMDEFVEHLKKNEPAKLTPEVSAKTLRLKR